MYDYQEKYSDFDAMQEEHESKCEYVKKCEDLEEVSSLIMKELHSDKPNFEELSDAFHVLDKMSHRRLPSRDEDRMFKNLQDWINWNNGYLKSHVRTI
jgi:hypothetical protein